MVHWRNKTLVPSLLPTSPNKHQEVQIDGNPGSEPRQHVVRFILLFQPKHDVVLGTFLRYLDFDQFTFVVEPLEVRYASLFWVSYDGSLRTAAYFPFCFCLFGALAVCRLSFLPWVTIVCVMVSRRIGRSLEGWPLAVLSPTCVTLTHSA